jgi:hypothetical protein
MVEKLQVGILEHMLYVPNIQGRQFIHLHHGTIIDSLPAVGHR